MSAITEAYFKLKIIRRELVNLINQVDDMMVMLHPSRPIDQVVVHTALRLWGDNEWHPARTLINKIQQLYPLLSERRIAKELTHAGFNRKRRSAGISYARPASSPSAPASES